MTASVRNVSRSSDRVCEPNLGPASRRQRRRIGLIGLVVAAMASIGFVWLNTGVLFGLVLFPVIAASWMSWAQAREGT